MEFDAIMNYLSDISREEIFVNIRYHEYVIACQEGPSKTENLSQENTEVNQDSVPSDIKTEEKLDLGQTLDDSFFAGRQSISNIETSEYLLTHKYKKYRQDFEFLNNFKSNVNKISLSSELIEHLSQKYQGLRTKVSKKSKASKQNA